MEYYINTKLLVQIRIKQLAYCMQLTQYSYVVPLSRRFGTAPTRLAARRGRRSGLVGYEVSARLVIMSYMAGGTRRVSQSVSQ